ncbi:Elongation of very long chain fatty acids protein 7 [Trachymyrmex cornetzi]|uniref:Elongation of very long chain fatty acids protein n=1 Tax=Trachymyrmex cornetzi TaxID=471704 RepID=A0A195EEV7_9HYME|nr:Elongation of very long chain fatty acids protein 7 [Trachymyrmex cornetzi]
MVDTWPLMESPGPMLCIVGAYLLFVLKVGPKMMEKRPAFELNAVMIGYNAFQVLFSIWLTTLVSLIFYSPCNLFHYLKTGKISRGAWWYFFAKVIELLDTVFFVLRKKQNQITFLHVFHHSTTAVFSWCYLKFLPGEQGIVIGFLNSTVHIIMYSYYLIAALGPKYRKYIWWKKYMTWIQLMQFGLMLVYLVLTLIMDCRTSKALTYFFTTIVIIFIYLFSDFYHFFFFTYHVPSITTSVVHQNRGNRRAMLYNVIRLRILIIIQCIKIRKVGEGHFRNIVQQKICDSNRTFGGAQGLVRMALDQYTEILTTVSDPRVSDWPLMDSPVPTILIVLLYLYGVVIFGPRMMANRKPYKLRGVLVAYNAFQVVFSLGMMYEHLMSGWLLDYSYKCQPVDYSHNPSALRMANLCWWYFISKFTEFADTVRFIFINSHTCY